MRAIRKTYVWGWLSYLLPTSLLFLFVLLKTDASYIYPLDDSYIHLSVAKQLVESGIWGISPGEFAAVSSSPLYTLLLSILMVILGNQTWLPLVINSFFGGVLVHWLNQKCVQLGWESALLILLIPLPFLVLLGMEHTLQLLLVLWWLSLLDKPKSGAWQTILAAFLLIGIRYEGLFLIAGSSVLHILHKDWKQLGLHISGAAIALCGFGLFFWINSGFFFPLSVSGKGGVPGLDLGSWLQIVRRIAEGLYDNPFMLLSLCLLLFQLRKWPAPPSKTALPLLVAMTLHLAFAAIGGARYEAYLIGASLFISLDWFRQIHWQHLPNQFSKLAHWGLIVCISLPFIIRAAFFSFQSPVFSQNIYHQQIQMATFLQRHFPNAHCAANDIGAITYFTDIRLTDLTGLSDPDVRRLRQDGRYTPTAIDSLTQSRQTELALVHDIWVGSVLPETWVKIGEWRIPDNRICADESVSLYACQQKMVRPLKTAWERFHPEIEKKMGK
ncbi:MAG: hypothetical protein AAF206_27515 [Bacteroidota bacterium]